MLRSRCNNLQALLRVYGARTIIPNHAAQSVQQFAGPPENVRDHVMAASRALMGGDWRQAYQHVASLTVWSLLSGKHDPKGLMRSKLQECGLQTYLFASGSYYQSLSLEQLCQMFELPEERVSSFHSTPWKYLPRLSLFQQAVCAVSTAWCVWSMPAY